MPKGFTEREKELIRARIFQNGQKAFATFGLRKTSVEELTQAAGISKGAFYIFYDSKEALFMDVLEEAERSFRERVLAVIQLPGPSPRARLKAVFLTAFSIWKQMPLLRQVTQVEYALLLEKMPPEKVQEHLNSDRLFVEELIRCCQAAGILISAGSDQMAALMTAMFFVSLHEDDFGAGGYRKTIDLLLDLISAYCVGEVPMERTASPAPKLNTGGVP
jgi:AcrR family transcriptional regulator